MKIEFYVLPPQSASMQGYLFACRLAEEIYKKNQRLHIHTSSKEEAEKMNQLLWTYSDNSFIPHGLYGDKMEPPPPILISYEPAQTMITLDPAPSRGTTTNEMILLNIGPQIPAFYAQFSRVLEIVFPDPIMQQWAREHYRQYRENGFEIITHKLAEQNE